MLSSVLSFWMIRGVNTGQVNSLFASLEPLLRSKDLPPIVRIEVSLYAAAQFQLWMAEYDRCLRRHSERG